MFITFGCAQIKHKRLWFSALNSGWNVGNAWMLAWWRIRAGENGALVIVVAIDFRFIMINQYTKCSYSKIVYGFYHILKSTYQHHWQLGNPTTTQIMHFRGYYAMQCEGESANAYAKFMIKSTTATWALQFSSFATLCWHRRNEVSQLFKPYEFVLGRLVFKTRVTLNGLLIFETLLTIAFRPQWG